jgi:exopolysaccharide production protein ExoZ
MEVSHRSPPRQATSAPTTGFMQVFELSRAGAAAHLAPMEGLRGFAVFLVFLVHCCALLDPRAYALATVRPWVAATQIIGNAGVDLFFVLSGFLIYGSLIDREQPFLGFMRRRVERLYPTFSVVFLVYLVLSYTVPSESKLPTSPGELSLYLLANYLLLPGIFPIKPMITVAWSLSFEMFFYLLVPLLVTGLGMRRWTSAQRVRALVALSVLAFVPLAWFEGPLRLVVFVPGMLLFERTQKQGARGPSSAVAAGTLVLCFALLLVPVPAPWSAVRGVLLLGAAFYVVCFTCFSHPGAALSRWLCWSPLRWLGNMSYSYYLLHGLSLKALFLVLRKVMPGIDAAGPLASVIMPAAFLFTLVPCALLFVFVERPWSLRPRRQPVAAPQEVSGLPLFKS